MLDLTLLLFSRGWRSDRIDDRQRIAFRDLVADLDQDRRDLDQINAFDFNANILKRRPEADLLYSVQGQRWKLIWRPTRPERSELYDLEADPGQEENLIATDPDRAESMRRELEARVAQLGQDGLDAASAPDAETIAKLAALGYVVHEANTVDADEELRFELPNVEVPTLVIVGSQDILTPLADSEELAGLIPDSRLAVIRGGAHGFMFENAATFNETVLDFLSWADASGEAAPRDTASRYSPFVWARLRGMIPCLSRIAIR